jgi:hypothetical protein
VSECNREASIMRRPWPTRGCCAMGKKFIFVLCRRRRYFDLENDSELRSDVFAPLSQFMLVSVNGRNTDCNTLSTYSENFCFRVPLLPCGGPIKIAGSVCPSLCSHIKTREFLNGFPCLILENFYKKIRRATSVSIMSGKF